MNFDVLIIGGGITGCSIAYELSKFDLKIGLIERENDVAMKTTKANSAIIHAGYDAPENTMMAKLNVMGNELTPELAKKLNFHFKKIGSLVLGREEDLPQIERLYQRGRYNGVKGLKILKSREEIVALGEKNLQEDICCALYAPSAGIVSPWEMCLAFACNAKENGVEFFFDQLVISIEHKENGYLVKTEDKEYFSSYVINCAGAEADRVYNLLKPKKTFEILPCRGEYFLLDKSQGDKVEHVLFQMPDENGKGVLVAPTVHGNLIVGPNADFKTSTKDGVNNHSHDLNFVKTKSRKTTEAIDFSQNIRNFAGVRATLVEQDDFLIGESEEFEHFINFAGIKSPGLSCNIAFGLEAVEILKKSGLKLAEKTKYNTYVLPTYFKELSDEEKDQKIAQDPDYGQVICRCETITEGEIKKAMHMPLAGTTIDAIKRRCNAGMGRCQGGFCAPKVFELLMKELNLDYTEVYQDRKGSRIVVERTKGEGR